MYFEMKCGFLYSLVMFLNCVRHWSVKKKSHFPKSQFICMRADCEIVTLIKKSGLCHADGLAPEDNQAFALNLSKCTLRTLSKISRGCDMDIVSQYV